MDRMFDFFENHFWAVALVFAILGIVGTLWAYDGDPKCLIAECRRIK